MTKLLLILMVVGLWSGCGGDSPTGEEKKELLIWTTTYDDGSVEEEYQYYHHPDNNRRIKDGWYNSFYKNGEYWEVGTYKDNERDGEWTSFSDDGKETKVIYKNGEKWSGEFWINVKVDSGGTVETEDDVPDDENVWRGLFTYDNGKWVGLVVFYWRNGNKRGEGLWGRSGKPEGKWVSYHESGKVWEEGNFVNGKQEGEWVSYYESGEIRWKGEYKVHKMDGKWVWYTVDGDIWDEDTYENGVCVEMCEGDE